jgi:two-component system, LuxR family, response regulator FixJ
MSSDHFVAALPATSVERARTGIEGLTARERQVVALALNGVDNKVIAYDLGLAHSTVRVLIARAALKLGARSRHELLERAAVLFGKLM